MRSPGQRLVKVLSQLKHMRCLAWCWGASSSSAIAGFFFTRELLKGAGNCAGRRSDRSPEVSENRVGGVIEASRA